jgi:hypothetical protein
MKQANVKARELLAKLERLADPANGGAPGEIAAANIKLERLRSRFDFSVPAPEETFDLFAQIRDKRRARRAAHIHTFEAAEFDIASSVKWAIEQATGIPCVFRGGDLLASAREATARKLGEIARHIADAFRELLGQFGRLQGVTACDRRVFIRGLYDGMMGDTRDVGERLPSAVLSRSKRTRPKKGAVALAPGLAVHPYTVALSLGRQIRFAVPLEEIVAELDQASRPAIASAAEESA